MAGFTQQTKDRYVSAETNRDTVLLTIKSDVYGQGKSAETLLTKKEAIMIYAKLEMLLHLDK